MSKRKVRSYDIRLNVAGFGGALMRVTEDDLEALGPFVFSPLPPLLDDEIKRTARYAQIGRSLATLVRHVIHNPQERKT